MTKLRIATSRSDWYLVKFPVAIKAQGSGLRTTYFRSLLRLILAVSPTRVFSRVATTRVKCHLWHVSLLHTHAYTEHVKPRMRRNKLRKPHSAVGALAQRRRGPDPLRSGTPAGRAGRRWAVAALAPAAARLARTPRFQDPQPLLVRQRDPLMS